MQYSFFFFRVQLASHLHNHPLRALHCQKCGEAFERRMDFNTHLFEKHSPPEFPTLPGHSKATDEAGDSFEGGPADGVSQLEPPPSQQPLDMQLPSHGVRSPSLSLSHEAAPPPPPSGLQLVTSLASAADVVGANASCANGGAADMSSFMQSALVVSGMLPMLSNMQLPVAPNQLAQISQVQLAGPNGQPMPPLPPGIALHANNAGLQNLLYSPPINGGITTSQIQLIAHPQTLFTNSALPPGAPISLTIGGPDFAAAAAASAAHCLRTPSQSAASTENAPAPPPPPPPASARGRPRKLKQSLSVSVSSGLSASAPAPPPPKLSRNASICEQKHVKLQCDLLPLADLQQQHLSANGGCGSSGAELPLSDVEREKTELLVSYYESKLSALGKLFKCNACEIVFYDRGLYFLHRSTHQSADAAAASVPLSSGAAADPLSPKPRHLSTTAPQMQMKTEAAASDSQQDEETSNAKRGSSSANFVCSVCERNCVDRYQFAIHFLNEHRAPQ